MWNEKKNRGIKLIKLYIILKMSCKIIDDVKDRGMKKTT